MIMSDNKKEIYQKVLDPQLLEGLIKLSQIEPAIAKALQPDNTYDLCNRLVAAFLITIDNRNKVLKTILDKQKL